jgi:hypothetical protein
MLSRQTPKRAAPKAPRFPLTAWAGAAWTALVLALMVLADDGHCSIDSPCEGSWLAPLLFGALTFGIVAQFVSARLGLAGGLTAAFSIVAISLADVAPVPWPALIIAVATLTGLSLVTARLDQERRSRRREQADTGPELRMWPGPRALPLPWNAVAAAALASAAAAGAFGVGFIFEQRETAWQDATPQSTYRVTAHSEDALTVYAQNDDRQISFEAAMDVDDYPVGTTVRVWDDSGKVRPVAEPYDPFGWQMLGVALAAIAFASGLRLADLRLDLRAVLSGPVPCKRVGVLGWGIDEVVIFDSTDAAGRHPRLRFRTFEGDDTRLDTAEPATDAETDLDIDEIDDWPEVVEPPLGATAYGYLLPGEVVAVELDDGPHLVPARRLESAHDLPRPTVADVTTGEVLAVGDSPASIAEPKPDTPPAEDGLVLGARGRRVAIGIAELAIAMIGMPLIFIYDVFEFEGALDLVVFGGNAMIVLWALAVSGFAAMTSSIHARPTGVVCVGILRTTTVPWSVLSGAWGEADHLVLRTVAGQDVPFMLPIPWIKETDQHEQVVEASRRLTARIRLETAVARGGTAALDHFTRRWRPAGLIAIMLYAAVSIAGIAKAV